MSFRAVAILLVAMAAAGHLAQAKRGCSAFGHSCYGGHGKRSANPTITEMDSTLINKLMARRGQDEVAPAVYPGARVLAGEDVIPVRDGGAASRDLNNLLNEIVRFRLRDLFKHWMGDYHRAQFNPEENHFGDLSM